MRTRNSEMEKHKKIRNRLLRLGRGAVAALLLSGHIAPGIVMASGIETEQNEPKIEDAINLEQKGTVDEENITITNVEESASIDESSNESNVSDTEVDKESEEVKVHDLSIDELNLLRDGNFEESISGNSVWETKNGTAGFDLEGNKVGVIPEGTHDAFVLQSIDTVPGREYTLSADVLVSNVADGNVSGSLFTIKETNEFSVHGPVVEEVALVDTGNEWERVSLEFTATTSKTYFGIVKWADADNQDALNTQTYFDNVSVTTEEIDEDTGTETDDEIENEVEDETDTESDDEIENVENYKVVWQDNFEVEDLDQNYWGYELGNIRGNEMQHYSSSRENVYIEDGNLILQVTDRPEEDQYRNTERLGNNARLVKYNSGSVRTHGKLDFLYGRIEARMRLPKGKGAFPAFWTLGSDFHLDGRISNEHGYGWPQSGEIDIMEMIGAPTEERADQGEVANGGTSNNYIHGTAHFFYENVHDVDGDGAYGYIDSNGNFRGDTNVAGGHSVVGDYNDGFHVFGIEWYPDRIEWFVDDVVYNTMSFEDSDNPENQERLNAAKMAFNRPHYIQMNLATGGNWPGDAGDYLGADDTRLEIDWVKWSLNEEQEEARAAYYANAPQINGVENMTIVQGQDVNFLEDITTNLSEYTVDFSIENEYMFENTNGRNEVTMVVESSDDIEGLANLTPGVYNIHYSAFPTNAQIQGKQYPEYPISRKSAMLTVLPNELVGIEGETLGNIKLPEGMDWERPEQILGSADSYDVVFRRLENAVARAIEGNERRVFVEIPDNIIVRDTSNEEEPTNDERLEELEDRLTELEELVNRLDRENSAMNTEIDQLLAQIAALQIELAQSSDVTSDLEERVTALESRLAELEDALSSEEGETTTEDVTPDEEAPTEEGASVDETESSSENHVTSEDETLAQKSEDESDLPDTGEANTFGILLSGIALLVVGTTIAFKVKNEA